MAKLLKSNWGYAFTIAFALLAIAYFALMGDNVWFQIHDNLDSNMAYFEMLRNGGLWLDPEAPMPFLGGTVEAREFFSPLKVYNYPFIFFEPHIGLEITFIASIAVSVLGSSLLGREILGEKWNSNKNIVVTCGLIYGILPVFPATQMCSASLPLLFWALYRLYKTGDKKMYFIIGLYPMLSSLVLFEIFICGYLLAFFIVEALVRRRPLWRMLFALVVFMLGVAVVDWSLFQSFLFGNEASIRDERVGSGLGLQNALTSMVDAFVNSQYHSASSHALVVMPVCLIYLVFRMAVCIKGGRIKDFLKDPVAWLFMWVVFNTFVYGLSLWSAFRVFLSSYVPVLGSVNLGRTLWFNGFIWYFMFAVVLVKVRSMSFRWGRVGAGILLILSFFCVAATPSTYNHIRIQADQIWDKFNGRSTMLSYSEFYSQELFEKAKLDVGYEGEWAVAFGMHPAVLEFNGIKTLDGYYSGYTLRYKKQFGKLIAPELGHDEVSRKYFQGHGIRAYVFSDELSYKPTRAFPKESIPMKIDPEVFKEMGGEYVFSRAEVSNAAELGLELAGTYEEKGYPYCLRVYRSIG